MSALLRQLERRGQDASLVTFDPDMTEASRNEYGTPTDFGAETAVETTALLDISRSDPVEVTVHGERQVFDGVVMLPSSLALDPEATEEKPQVQVDGAWWKIMAKDPSKLASDGVERFFVRRSG